jgi:hypothetical protein
MPIVTAEVQAEIDELLATNAPGGVAVVSVSADGLDMTVNVTVDSNNSFGRAIGAGDTISLETTASGHIEIGDFKADNLLRPFGLRNDPRRPYQCYLLSVPVVANQPQVCQAVSGDDVDLLEIFNFVEVKRCSAPSTLSNLRDGIDHLVETDADTTTSRSARDACVYGHHVTMPNAAELTTPSTSQLTQGLARATAPLAAASPPLWDYLVSPAPCDRNTVAQGTLQEQSDAMRRCLENGAARFGDGVVQSPRFSWAIRTAAGAGNLREYDSLKLIFLNTIVWDGASLTPEQAETLFGPPPGAADPGNVGAVTMYELRLSDLASSDQSRLMEPAGTDWLEFSLTN